MTSKVTGITLRRNSKNEPYRVFMEREGKTTEYTLAGKDGQKHNASLVRILHCINTHCALKEVDQDPDTGSFDAVAVAIGSAEVCTCPRCNKEFIGRPALSRHDGKTQVCPICGVEESLLATAGDQLAGTEMHKRELIFGHYLARRSKTMDAGDYTIEDGLEAGWKE